MDEGLYVTSNVKLVRPLGRGGMGAVWVAHHETLDAEVAVKFVSAEIAEKDPSALSRFKREAALSAKIKSPHVVKTFDHGVMDDGRPYIVMELLEGETLGARLGRVDSLSARESAIVVAQVAQVLEEAHRLGVVHRDIKPDNVFLIDSGYDLFCKVLDFGIAKQTALGDVSHVTDTGAIVGTPEYMSPQQLLSTRTAGPVADLWALAVLAYHCLTGRVPFMGETLPSLSLEICNSRFTAPSKVLDLIPPEIDNWFARALHVKPEERFDNVLEMSDAFRHIVRASLGSGERRPAKRRSSAPPGFDDDDAPPDSGRRLSSPREVLDSTPDDDGLGLAPIDDDVNDSGVRASISSADADTSGHRRALAETGDAATSPTFSGSSSSLSPESQVERRRSRFKLAGVLVAAVLVAAAADLALRTTAPSSDTAEVAPAAPATPPAASAGTEPATNSEPTTPATSTEPTSSGPAPSSATASASASVSAAPATPPIRQQAKGPRRNVKPKPDCKNPYIVQDDGTLKVRPECL